MHLGLLAIGTVVWALATLILRLAGQYLVPTETGWIVVLFLASMLACAWVARFACRRAGLPRTHWTAGAISLLLPTLVLDPFSSAFFGTVFPSMPARAAGVFGGWMLSCCAGALVGSLDRAKARG
jgi:hypothetical protein